MARKSTEVAKSPGRAAAPFSDAPLDQSLLEEAHAKAGAGTSQHRDDVLIPFIYVMQSNSPQAIRKNPRYVEGCEPGMFLRTDTKEVMEEFNFQPCFFQKKINEWIPREDGGGLVRVHDVMPADAVQHPEKERWMQTADGEHDLIDTRYHYGHIVYPDGRLAAACMPMKGTEHGVSRGWMVLMNNRQMKDGTITPSWWTVYRFVAKSRSNSAGEWFVREPAVAGWASPELREAGEKLFRQIEAGERKIDVAADAEEGADRETESAI